MGAVLGDAAALPRLSESSRDAAACATAASLLAAFWLLASTSCVDPGSDEVVRTVRGIRAKRVSARGRRDTRGTTRAGLRQRWSSDSGLTALRLKQPRQHGCYFDGRADARLAGLALMPVGEPRATATAGRRRATYAARPIGRDLVAERQSSSLRMASVHRCSPMRAATGTPTDLASLPRTMPTTAEGQGPAAIIGQPANNLRAPLVLSNQRAHGRTTVSIASQGDRVARCSRPARGLRSTR
jgi:hypothetical protein